MQRRNNDVEQQPPTLKKLTRVVADAGHDDTGASISSTANSLHCAEFNQDTRARGKERGERGVVARWQKKKKRRLPKVKLCHANCDALSAK